LNASYLRSCLAERTHNLYTMSDNFEVLIEKKHWNKAVTTKVQKKLKDLGDQYNIAATAESASGKICLKGAPHAIHKARASLVGILKENFPGSDIDFDETVHSSKHMHMATKDLGATHTRGLPAPAAAPELNPKFSAPERAIGPDLIWQCIRGNNSFLRKAPVGIKGRMSADPGNLTSQHSFKYSGVANTEPVGMECVKVGKKENIMLTKGRYKSEHQFRPETRTFKTGISKCPKRGLEALDKQLGKKLYRRDLLGDAKEKYLKVKKSLKKKKKPAHSRRRPASA